VEELLGQPDKNLSFFGGIIFRSKMVWRAPILMRDLCLSTFKLGTMTKSLE
jgi:hypothetical protein